MSLIKSALNVEPGSRFTLFFGNRASSAVLFREEIEDLKNRYLERLSVVYIMRRAVQDIDLFNGSLDVPKVAQLLTFWLDPASTDIEFVCGPKVMAESSEERHG